MQKYIIEINYEDESSVIFCNGYDLFVQKIHVKRWKHVSGLYLIYGMVIIIIKSLFHHHFQLINGSFRVHSFYWFSFSYSKFNMLIIFFLY
jgi:hypothetical protein